MKTTRISEVLKAMGRGDIEKQKLAASFGITLDHLSVNANRGYWIAEVNEKQLLMTRTERDTLIKFGVIDE